MYEFQQEEWLTPCQIAYELRMSVQHCRRLVNRALKSGHFGFERKCGRLFAKLKALRDFRDT
ncbi:hypothetical protein [Croceibacterium salegens]|uniref:hypothetical protein n=1 Tax=Croceibacterium salegens TaxID=1737568 RepID=UPI001F224FA9|nr:hypothetical protein [Croceibacterium salegens]